MMLYENANVKFLWVREDDIRYNTHFGYRVTINEAGVAEVIIPDPQKIVITHVQNLVITTDLEAKPDGINAATIGDYISCDECGLLIHKSEWNDHFETCVLAFLVEND